MKQSGLKKYPINYNTTTLTPCSQVLFYVFENEEVIEIYGANCARCFLYDILTGSEPDLADATHFAIKETSTPEADEIEAIAEYSDMFKRLPRGYTKRFIPRAPRNI